MGDDELTPEERDALYAASAESSGDGHTSVEVIRRALLEDPADMWAAIRGHSPAREEVPGSYDLILRGKAHTFFGERESGKSLIVALAMCAMAAAGERVLYLDRENGDAVTAERIQDILDAHPEWEGRLDGTNLVGKHYPQVHEGWNGADVAKALDGFTVVVLDSMREFIGQMKGSNNSDDDVTRLMNLIITPLVSRNVAVILTDNTGHEHTHRQKGAGGKMDGVPQIYRVVPGARKFTPDETGEAAITCTRSRVGDFGRKWTAALGGGVYELHQEDSPADRGPDKRESFRVAAVRVLRHAGGPLSATAVISGARDYDAKVRKATALEWLRELSEDAASGIHVDPSGRGFRAAPDSRFAVLSTGSQNGSQTGSQPIGTKSQAGGTESGTENGGLRRGPR